MASDNKRRSLLKTLSWRVTATLITFAASWILSGDLSLAFSIGGVEFIAKMFVYYQHERLWDKIKFGRNEPPEYMI